jgi:hypothetical protein
LAVKPSGLSYNKYIYKGKIERKCQQVTLVIEVLEEEIRRIKMKLRRGIIKRPAALQRMLLAEWPVRMLLLYDWPARMLRLYDWHRRMLMLLEHWSSSVAELSSDRA